MKHGLQWYRHNSVEFLAGVQGMGADTIGAYIVLLDLIYSRGGDTRRDDRHLAGILGCSIRLATALTDRLIDLGKITFDGVILGNKRAETELEQQRSIGEAKVEAQRSRREREAASKENNGLEDKHMSLKPSRIEENIKNKKELPTVVQKKTASKGSRLPEDFRPDLAWSQAQGLSNKELKFEFEQFTDYWRQTSGAKGVKLDWQATWRTWIRKRAKDKGSGRPQSVGEYSYQKMMEAKNAAGNTTAGLFDEGQSRTDQAGLSLLEDLASGTQGRNRH